MAMVVAGPALTVTVAVCVMATPPTVAETVLAPRPVELSVPVATPPASVVPAGWVSVFPVPEAVRTKLAPPIGRPLASRAVTVMVLTLVPALAVMALGAAVTVVPVELAGRGVAVAVNVVVALTMTAGRMGTAVPVVALWLLPACTAIVAGAPAVPVAVK